MEQIVAELVEGFVMTPEEQKLVNPFIIGELEGRKNRKVLNFQKKFAQEQEPLNTTKFFIKAVQNELNHKIFALFLSDLLLKCLKRIFVFIYFRIIPYWY